MGSPYEVISDTRVYESGAVGISESRDPFHDIPDVFFVGVNLVQMGGLAFIEFIQIGTWAGYKSLCKMSPYDALKP